MAMENSQTKVKIHESRSSFNPEFIDKNISIINIREEEMVEPGQPHEALFLVLSYLNLFELLTTSKVCQSLRDAVNKDVLLWLDIVVKSPLNMRINDDVLLKITSKAHGRLRTLALMNCVRITDDGLQRVIENNLHINKLYVPACTGLTPDGIVRIVKMLTENNNSLKLLRLKSLYNITKEHLQALYSCLKVNLGQLQQQPNMFHEHQRHQLLLTLNDTNRPIDIELCPKCNNVGLVYDCPRERCRRMRERPLIECRGCYGCITRCEGCGGCVESEEYGETICFDTVCLDCWFRLPKCNLCNKSYCIRHTNERGWSEPAGSSAGFVCDVCSLGTVNEEFFRTWRNYD